MKIQLWPKIFLFACITALIAPSCSSKKEERDAVDLDFFNNEINSPGTVHEGDTVVWNVVPTDSLHPIDSVTFVIDGI